MSVDIQVYVDGSFSHSVSADVPRTDLNEILDVTGDHGFVETFAVTNGWHDVCVYVVGIGPDGLPDGQVSGLGCK
jgi:nitrogen fixation protein